MMSKRRSLTYIHERIKIPCLSTIIYNPHHVPFSRKSLWEIYSSEILIRYLCVKCKSKISLPFLCYSFLMKKHIFSKLHIDTFNIFSAKNSFRKKTSQPQIITSIKCHLCPSKTKRKPKISR